MEALLFFILFTVIPLWLGYKIAVDRNRTGWKGIILILFTGWVGVLGMAFFLKTRDKKTGYLK